MEEIYQFFTLIISSIALIVSGIALGWNIYRDCIDKAKIKITFRFPGMPKDNSFEEIWLNVTNNGKRSIVLNICGFFRKNKTMFIIPRMKQPFNNKKLEPYESIDIDFQPIELINEIENLESFVVVDTIGTGWKVDQKNWHEFLLCLKRIKREQDQKN